jgi:putative Mn2+ efflux pump MntP
MDAFSLALSIGTMGFSLKNAFLLSFCTGIFHFFMPIFGSILGATFINHFHINTAFLSGIIFTYIALCMLKEFKEDDEKPFVMNLTSTLIFALGVSLDSFGVGFVLQGANRLISPLIFSGFSFSFTFLGLELGKALNKIIGRISILLGALIMIILALLNFVNF